MQISINGVIAVPQAYFDKGQVVIDSCFETLDSITVQNTDNNAWAGTMSVTHNGHEDTLSCDKCGGDPFEHTIVADGNGDGDKLGPTNCLNGDACVFTISGKMI